MAFKKTSYHAGSWALLLSVLGIIFIVNFFSNRFFTRLDLTRTKQYTLSQSTKNILANLPDIVTIEAVYSSNLPSPWNQYTREVIDLLHEYEVYGKGKIHLKVIDPTNRPDIQEELSKKGITPVALPVRSLDQAGTIKVYATINVEFYDKSDTLPYVFTTENLEYELTSTIDRLTREKLPKVGFLDIDKDRKLMEEFGKLKSYLEKEFEVDSVDVRGGKPVEEEVNVLLVINPYRLTDRDLFEIDQYIMRGGNAIFLADGVRVFLQRGQFGQLMPFYAMALNEQMDKLGEMLKHYGVKRNYDLVQDKNYEAYPILGPLGRPYPLFPVVDMKTGQVEHPITQGLDFLVFAWASSLEVQKLPEGVKAVELVKTSPESWVQAGGQLQVDPMREPIPPLPIADMGPKQRTLAVLLTGKFPSYFEGKEAPPVEEGDTASPPPQPPERRDQSPETNILVVGNSMFVSNQNPVLTSSNLDFIVSAVEWMTGGNKLSDIRKRKVQTKPVGELTTGDVILAGFIAPLLAPVGVIIFGVIRFAFRKSQKKKFLESVES